MPLTVRLSPRTERTLNALAKRRGTSRSDVVREAIAHYGAAETATNEPESAYAGWEDVLGVVDLGVRDPARTTGEQFAAKLREQTRARRPR